MMGVRRTTVTEVASELQKAGMITYQRGRIHIIELEQIRARACECDEDVRSHYRRIFASNGGGAPALGSWTTGADCHGSLVGSVRRDPTLVCGVIQFWALRRSGPQHGDGGRNLIGVGVAIDFLVTKQGRAE